MTQKEIIMLASDPDLMALLAEIAEEEKNLVHKTVYEQKTAKKRMKNRAAEIVETVKARTKRSAG